MTTEFAFNFIKASALLDLMAHPARLRVLELISEKEWDVGSLAIAVNISQSALSQHLKKLRDAKLVETRRERQTVMYFCREEAVGKILETLRAITVLR
ncbi:ArsR/SmtB family transcription factor [Neorhizobium vignae]|uniref:ArsR/SmtB family transcription factor n=1 Tax=Neorhizobium vignae TaxID=690585 RepID=UPI000561D512|nr:metalloregulator ArsR/SmtB family transcription factor [Neorhizobium vignae]